MWLNKKIEFLPTELLLKMLIFIILGVNILGFLPPLMDMDSTLYATISKTIIEKNDWVNLYFEDKDWLDKPHFQMWVSAFFYKIFGFNAFAFRMASFIFFVMAIIYTYQLAKHLFQSSSKIVPLLSVLIFITAQHILLSNYDVKAEIIITGLLVASIYHLIRRKESFLHLLLASFFMGCAIMTKGMYLLIPALSLWFFEEMFKKNFLFFLHWRFILFVILCIGFMSPELICLYLQFDRHLEKIIFERTNVSGIRFFFWDSQFGRFTNTGPIKGKGDMSFFLHTILWAFFPWSLLFYFSCFKEWIRNKCRDIVSLKLIAIILPLWLIFSISKFQLPHYVIILFPFFAILTAKYISSSSFFKENKQQIIFILTQIFSFLVLILLAAIVILYFGFTSQIYFTLLCNALVLILFLILWQKSTFKKFLVQISITVIFVNTVLFVQFYPDLLQYQYGYQVNQYLKEYTSTKNIFVCDNLNSPSMQFYSSKKLIKIDQVPYQQDTFFVLCRASTKEKLETPLYPIKSFPSFHVSRLKMKFINKNTRYETLDSLYLMSNYPSNRN